jgi:heat shock protein HtpX
MVQVDRKQFTVGGIGVKYPLIKTRMLLSLAAAAALLYFWGVLWLATPVGAVAWLLADTFGVVGHIAGGVLMAGTFAAIPYYFYRTSFKLLADAEEMTREDSPDWFDEFDFVEQECERRGIAEVKLYHLPSPAANAFALGRRQNGHVVLTHGLVDALDDHDELRAVVAHELGHIQHRDSIVLNVLLGYRKTMQMVFVALSTVVGTAMTGSAKAEWYDSRRKSRWLFVPIWLFHNSISRHREYVADADAAEATAPEHMKGALDSIDTYNGDKPDADIPPSLCLLGNSGTGLLERLRNDHPPIESRKRRVELLASAE